MSTSATPSSLSVEQLLQAVDQLSPAQRCEFQRRLASRQEQATDQDPDDAALVQAAKARLPVAAERRLKRLIARSEQGKLTPKELADYQALAQEAQRIDVTRAEALAELARRRGKPVQEVQAELGKRDGTDGT